MLPNVYVGDLFMVGTLNYIVTNGRMHYE